jgi:hypothetical protein
MGKKKYLYKYESTMKTMEGEKNMLNFSDPPIYVKHILVPNTAVIHMYPSIKIVVYSLKVGNIHLKQ